jgi:hypothetical protein
VIHEIHEASRQNAPVLGGVDMAPPDPQRAQALRERAADQIAWPHSSDADAAGLTNQ